MIGTLFKMTDKTALNVQYRYFGTGKLKALDKAYRHESINVGVFYQLLVFRVSGMAAF